MEAHKVLVEAQGNLTHLLFLSPHSTNAVLSLSFITHSPHHPPFLPLISSFHKSLLPLSFSSILVRLAWAHHFCRVLIHFPLARLSIRLAGSSATGMQPLLHLLRSYLLIIPSVSIRADCCHFRPVCPCISLCNPPTNSTQPLLQQLPPSISLCVNRQAPVHDNAGG